MGYWSQFFDNFFKKTKSTKADIPFIHEAINLKSYPVALYLQWQLSGALSSILEAITTANNNRLITGVSVAKSVSIMQSSHANGWLIHCIHHPYTDQDYKHLAYHLQDKIKKNKYTLNLAEVKSQQRGENIETLVKYYLKPSLSARFLGGQNGGKANQLYGNITIEYKAINGNPFEFKFMANAYQDANYLPPDDYDLLLDLVLDY